MSFGDRGDFCGCFWARGKVMGYVDVFGKRYGGSLEGPLFSLKIVCLEEGSFSPPKILSLLRQKQYSEWSEGGTLDAYKGERQRRRGF